MAAVCCRPTATEATGTRSQGDVELADILRRYGPAFRRTHRLSADQHKALNAIEACRTAALGGHADACPRCGYARYAYHSCRNRHCPKCQTLTKARWIQARTADLLPVPYFHVVFSLPHELNSLVLFNRKALINLLFASASRTLADFGRHDLGGRLGFTMILHTWDQQLNAHMHLHALVAGGALADDGTGATHWVATGAKFLFPVHALGKVFRGKFLAGLKVLHDKQELTFPAETGMSADDKQFAALRDGLYRKAWNVYAKPPFDGPQRTLEYLGRYTHRVAISNHRILSADNGTVRFTYRDRRDRDQSKILALGAGEFLRRFCLHVLPAGLMRIRHFGFLASRSKAALLAQCRSALGQSPPPAPPPGRTAVQWILALTGVDITTCPRCGHRPLHRAELPPAPAHQQPPRRGPPSPIKIPLQ